MGLRFGVGGGVGAEATGREYEWEPMDQGDVWCGGDV